MENSKGSTKVYVLGAMIITISLIIISLSISYAFFLNTVDMSKGDKALNITSGELTMSITATNGDEAHEYINATAASLIEDGQVTESADYTAFTITLPGSSKMDSVNYSLYLTDIQMTPNFKSSDLRWALYKVGEATPTSSGDFSAVAGIPNYDDSSAEERKTLYSATSNISLNKVVSASEEAFTISKTGNNSATDSYKLYIWLSYSSSTLQNRLLEGQLKAKVGFKATSIAPTT